MTKRASIIVIGSGISGIYASHFLSKNMTLLLLSQIIGWGAYKYRFC